MDHLFIDTNVVLDLALPRPEFEESAQALFVMKDEGKIEIYISTLTLADVAYIAHRHGLDVFKVVNRFLNWATIIDLKKSFFSDVLSSGFKDFEDGLQYFSAASITRIDAIITRNTKDFKPSQIPVFTPSAYLKTVQR